MARKKKTTLKADFNQKKYEDYLTECELSENTKSAYLFAINQFFEMYDEIQKRNLIRYKEYLLNKDMSPKTVNLRISALSKYCEFIGKPDIKIKKIKIQKAQSVENVITRKQYEKLLQCLLDDGNTKWYLICSFLGGTGARISELLQFKKKDLEQGYVDLKTKGKHRRIYIPKKTAEKAKEYYKDLSPNDFLFLNRYGTHLTSRGVSQNLKSFAEKYEISAEVMHPHSFRHMFAIEFLKKNNNISLLADILGHSNINTTAIYLRMSEKEQRKKVNSIVDW